MFLGAWVGDIMIFCPDSGHEGEVGANLGLANHPCIMH